MVSSETLSAVLKRARKSPFYRSKLANVRTWEDVPETRKEDLRAHYPFGFLALDKSEIESYHESSGSEGQPIASYFSREDWEDIAKRFLRNGVSLHSGDTFFIKTPYSMVTTAHQAHAAARIKKVTVVPGDNRSHNMPYSRVLQLLKDLEVTVTWSLPTEPLLWRLGLEGSNGKVSDYESLRAFWVAGELLSGGKRLAIENVWGGKKVFQDYGSTETGSLAGECRFGNLHIWSDRVLFEILDLKTGRISQTGRGVLLVTPLYREAMPLLRYRIEDEVEINAPLCRCGSYHPMIRVLGRTSQQVRIQKQSLLPLEIEDAVYQEGNSFQLVLWRGIVEANSLHIETHALGSQDTHFAKRVADRLKVPVTASVAKLSTFIDPAIFRERLAFSKPRFLFQKSEDSHLGVQYTRGENNGPYLNLAIG